MQSLFSLSPIICSVSSSRSWYVVSFQHGWIGNGRAGKEQSPCTTESSQRRGRSWKMRKSLWIIALLFVATAAPNAHADSYYTITLDVLAETSPAPLPSFGVGTLLGSGALAGFMEYSFVPDIGAPTAPEAIPDFLTAETDPIYFCAGCNPPYPLTGTYIPQLPGSVVIYFPANSPTGNIDETIIDYAFPPTPDYYVYGTLQFSPVPTPEPGSGVLLLTGVGLLGLVTRKRIAWGLPQAS
jgi:hypothetical protein